MFVPKKPVSRVIISCDCTSNIITTLQKYNIEVIKTLKNPDLPSGLSAHADLQICIIGNTAITVPFAYEYYKDNLVDFNVIKGESLVQGAYPNDVSYNVIIANNCLYHNLKYTDSVILNLANKNNLRIYNVNQGYTKCTVCFVTENAIVTEDEGIAKTFKNQGFDVLLVNFGDVLLNGYKHGFLGGSSGLIDKNKLAFCGNIKTHQDFNKIIDFTKKYGVQIVSLDETKLVDVGSIIPII